MIRLVKIFQVGRDRFRRYSRFYQKTKSWLRRHPQLRNILIWIFIFYLKSKEWIQREKVSKRQKFWFYSGHIVRWWHILKWLQGEHKKCLQVGGGRHLKSGQEWLNGDLIAGDIYLDATKKLPFPDDSLDVIFTEQFFEHLSQEDGLHFLKEAYRVLKCGGILRQSTPDLEGLVTVYQDKNKLVSQAEAVSRHIQNHRKSTPYARATGCQFINDLFRLWGHKFLYDKETLEAITKEVGFKKFRWVNFGESDNPNLKNLERHANVEWMKNAFVMIYEAEK